jgi:hypothetical protein
LELQAFDFKDYSKYLMVPVANNKPKDKSSDEDICEVSSIVINDRYKTFQLSSLMVLQNYSFVNVLVVAIVEVRIGCNAVS